MAPRWADLKLSTSRGALRSDRADIKDMKRGHWLQWFGYQMSWDEEDCQDYPGVERVQGRWGRDRLIVT